MSLKRRNKVPFTVYFTEKQMRWLEARRKQTRVTVAEYVRAAVNRLAADSPSRETVLRWLNEPAD